MSRPTALSCSRSYGRPPVALLVGLLLPLLPVVGRDLRAAQPIGDRSAAVRGAVSTGAGEITVPGVTVVLRSVTTDDIGETTITDAEGTYRFEGLRPGTYRLDASFDGVRVLATASVALGPGDERRVDLVLTLTDEVEVRGRPAAEREPTGGRVIDASLLDRAPLADDVLALLPLLPGVVRSADGRIQVKGGQPNQGGYQVSGASVTDPSTGDFAFSLPSQAVESVQVLGNPFAAEYGRFTSGVTVLETRRAGDSWTVTPNSFIPRIAVRRDGRWALGLRSFTPRITLGGPIVDRRLSLIQTAHFRYVQTPLTALEGEPTIDLTSFDSYTRVDSALTDRQQLTMALALFPRTLEYATLSTFTPREVTTTFRQRGFNAGGQYRLVLSPTTLFDSMVNVKRYDVDVFGRGQSPMIVTPERNHGNFFNDQSRNTWTSQWSAVVTRAHQTPLGEHLLKAGVDVLRGTYAGISTSRPIEVQRADGTRSRRITFEPASRQDTGATDVAFFVQDRWQASSAVVVELGLRADGDGVSGRTGVAPRAGLAFTPGGDDRTVLRGGVGVFSQPNPLNVGAFESFESRTETRFGPDGVTVLGLPEHLGHEVSRLDLPRSLVWTTEVDRRFGSYFILRLAHLRRSGRHEAVLDLVRDGPRSALQLTSDGRSRYWEQEVTLRYVRDERFDLTASYVRSRSRRDLNVFDAFFGNARAVVFQPNQFGLSDTDAPNRFLLFGSIPIGALWDVLPMLEIRDGFPFTTVDENQDLVGIRNAGGRFPVMASLDLAVQRKFRFANRNLRVGIRVFNVFNRRNYRDAQTNVDAGTFGQFFNPIERGYGATFWMDP